MVATLTLNARRAEYGSFPKFLLACELMNLLEGGKMGEHFLLSTDESLRSEALNHIP